MIISGSPCGRLFQSTLPREERHMTVQLHPHRRRFQSTLPREERPSLYLLGAHLHNFNPRSHERSDQTPRPNSSNRQYFNPRSHERSDTDGDHKILELNISIHAPTRGATDGCCGQMQLGYFNPRSHERSDIYPAAEVPESARFQSTLPREERQQYCTKNLFIFIQYRQ